MNRIQIMTLHALLAAFILPVAIMFTLTGSLYSWGIKGSYEDTKHTIALSEPIKADLVQLTELAKAEMQKIGISKPEGKPSVKKGGNSFWLEWTGSSKDISLKPTKNSLEAQLTVKDTTAYRRFVQLHKAKGGQAFKVYAVIFSVAIVLLLISGFIMAWQTPKLKRLTILASLTGFVSFIVFVLLS